MIEQSPPPRRRRLRDWRSVAADIDRAGTARGRARLGCCSIEGIRLAERALRAGVCIEAALLAQSLRADPAPRVQRLVAGLEEAGCATHVVADEVLGRLTGGRRLGGVVGLVRIHEAPPLPDVLRVAMTPAVLVVGSDIEDPGNVGALIRTALAGGAAGFVAVGRTDPYHPKAVRTSMGSLFKLPVLRRAAVGPLLEELAGLGVTRLGAVATGGTPAHRTATGRPAVALFLGSEAFGLPSHVAGSMDSWLTIPMASGIDSYSVNAAAAILLYELRRRGLSEGIRS